jgi:hypothetical protein
LNRVAMTLLDCAHGSISIGKDISQRAKEMALGSGRSRLYEDYWRFSNDI